MNRFETVKIGISIAGLAILWSLETWFPQEPHPRNRPRHILRNIGVSAIAAFVTNLTTAALTASIAHTAERMHFGLLRWIGGPHWLQIPLALLLMDGFGYFWHRVFHAVPMLWRFHRVHHSDSSLDLTSAQRFHPGDATIYALARAIAFMFFGVELWQMLLYEILLQPVGQFYHSNVYFPERWDRYLRWILVSPAMHHLHHSRHQPETNSNYAALFSFWDRLFGTWREPSAEHHVAYGLEDFDDEASQTISGLLWMPFRTPATAQPSGVAAQSGVVQPEKHPFSPFSPTIRQEDGRC